MTSTENTGSRRHRLWELPHGTLCPLMGVCLPLPVLRRILGKTLAAASSSGADSLGHDYEVHCTAINECTHRSPTSEALQRELDARHSLAVQRFAKVKTTEAVAAMWREESAGSDPGGALWASLTHARCDASLRERICSDIHMLQHQLGAGNRADLHRLQCLTHDHEALRHELASTQERNTRAMAERNAQVECLGSELMRLRALGIQKDSVIAALREDLADLQSPTGASPSRVDPGREARQLQQRLHRLERDLDRWQQTARQEGERASELSTRLAGFEARASTSIVQAAELSSEDAPGATDNIPPKLRDAAVLCVGGRTASVPAYKRLVEVTGGRFLHHDGGEQQSGSQLEASLAAADLVICQTGCISHDAYWRVKDHCKRTGKRCVFVDNPSASSLARSLRAMPESA
jgi:hypothetical protein